MRKSGRPHPVSLLSRGACKVRDEDSVCVMGRVTDTRQAGDTRWMGPGRLMDG